MANVSPASPDMPGRPASPDTAVHAHPARPPSAASLSARPNLLRARSDVGPRHAAPTSDHPDEASVDGHFRMRHGWDDQLNSEEYSNLLTSVR